MRDRGCTLACKGRLAGEVLASMRERRKYSAAQISPNKKGAQPVRIARPITTLD